MTDREYQQAWNEGLRNGRLDYKTGAISEYAFLAPNIEKPSPMSYTLAYGMGYRYGVLNPLRMDGGK